MKKRVFWVSGKKYYTEEAYNEARNALLYNDEQMQGFAQSGYDNGYSIMAGDRSEVVAPITKPAEVELEYVTLEWLHEQHKASHSDTGFRLWARTFLMRHYNIDVDSVSYIMHALNA